MARSYPLVIEKETGEPRYYPNSTTHLRYPAWKILILDTETEQRRSKKFFSYQEAKSAVSHFKEKLGPTYLIGVVSIQRGFGPPYSKVSDKALLAKNEMGYIWCPYCRTFRSFMYNAWREKKLCEFCQIVEDDFHVIANNPIFWSTEKIERIS